jgi:hypothetical protein
MFIYAIQINLKRVLFFKKANALIFEFVRHYIDKIVGIFILSL